MRDISLIVFGVCLGFLMLIILLEVFPRNKFYMKGQVDYANGRINIYMETNVNTEINWRIK